jgi:hypothetical protein
MSIRFRDLTPEQLAFVWNGFGSQQFSYNPPSFCFLDASKFHDFGYYRGGNELDRLAIEFRFLKECLNACVSSKENYKYIPIAFIYFIILLFVGPFVFEYGKKADSWELIEGRVKKDKESQDKKSVSKMIDKMVYGKTFLSVKRKY